MGSAVVVAGKHWGVIKCVSEDMRLETEFVPPDAMQTDRQTDREILTEGDTKKETYVCIAWSLGLGSGHCFVYANMRDAYVKRDFRSRPLVEQ